MQAVADALTQLAQLAAQATQAVPLLKNPLGHEATHVPWCSKLGAVHVVHTEALVHTEHDEPQA